MESGKISVIVPVYNTGKYLERCLGSLRNQSYKNIEFICVNDGSTDNSLALLQNNALQDDRVIIIDKENEGVSSARNAGLQIASGEYIMFVDSDDWIDTDTCEKALNTAKSMDADVVLWSYIREYPSKSLKTVLFENKNKIWEESKIKQLHRRMVGLMGNELSDPSKSDSIITVWGKLYHKSVLKNQYFVDTKLEDALFNISVFFNVKKAVFISDTYYHYFKDNTDSLTSGKYKSQLVTDWKTLYKMIEDLLKENKADEEFYEALHNRVALGIIQLGFGIVSDSTMTFSEKTKELNRILNMEHYRVAMKRLPLINMPIHWKVYFVCAKCRFTVGILWLSYVMNILRTRI